MDFLERTVTFRRPPSRKRVGLFPEVRRSPRFDFVRLKQDVAEFNKVLVLNRRLYDEPAAVDTSVHTEDLEDLMRLKPISFILPQEESKF